MREEKIPKLIAFTFLLLIDKGLQSSLIDNFENQKQLLIGQSKIGGLKSLNFICRPRRNIK